MTPELDQVIFDLTAFTSDPLGFVIYAFPWGEAGTELAEEIGPEEWQIRLLNSIRDKLASGTAVHDAVSTAIREARASGHGVGKSCVVSWIILWAIDRKSVV